MINENEPKKFNKAVCAAVHIVEAGETLYAISQKYGADYRRLMLLNGIKNPNNILPGQEICIPRATVPHNSKPAEAGPQPSPSPAPVPLSQPATHHPNSSPQNSQPTAQLPPSTSASHINDTSITSQNTTSNTAHPNSNNNQYNHSAPPAQSAPTSYPVAHNQNSVIRSNNPSTHTSPSNPSSHSNDTSADPLNTSTHFSHPNSENNQHLAAAPHAQSTPASHPAAYNQNSATHNNYPSAPPVRCSGQPARFHIIAQGDTLYGISRTYGIRLSQLMRCNPGIDPYNLQIGTRLAIPTPPPTRPHETLNISPKQPSSNSNSQLTAENNNDSQTPPASIQTAQNTSPAPDHEYAANSESALPNLSDASNINTSAASPNSSPQSEYTTNDSAAHSEQYSEKYNTDSDGIIYTVSNGETLTQILTHFNICLNALIHENPGVDFTGDLTGITLCIPYEDIFRHSSENQPYTVKSGDTLMLISETSGSNTDELLRINPCRNALDFSILGTKIRI